MIRTVIVISLCLGLFTSVLQAQQYAYISIANNTGTQSMLASTWAPVTGFSSNAASGITTGPSALTITQSGNYLVQASVSFKGQNSGVWSVGISINGATPASYSDRYISSSNDVGNVTLTTLQALNSGSISIMVRAPSASALTVVHAQLVAVDIDDISSYDSYAMLSVTSTLGTTVVKGTTSALNGFTSSETSSGWSAAGGQLTAGLTAGGTYLALFTMSYSGNSNTDFDGGISVNSSSLLPQMLCSRKLLTSSDVGNMTSAGIVTIASGNTVTPRLRNNETSDKTCTLEHGTLVLVQIAGGTPASEAASHASKAVASGQSLGPLTYNTPVTATGFSNLNTDASRWSLSSNQLYPIGVTAGVYLVTYRTSFSSNVASNIEFRVNKGGTLVPSLTTQRSTSSGGSNDNGAVGGFGLLSVSAASDVISMSLVNLDNSTTPTITLNSAVATLVRLDQTSTSALPVELTTFSAYYTGHAVTLRWRTETESNNFGFDIERMSSQQPWQRIGFIPGVGTTAKPQNYAFNDAAPPEGEIWYRLRQRDRDGSQSLSQEVLAVGSSDRFATSMSLYPNPMPDAANIQLTLGATGPVLIMLYDLLGREVQQVFDGELSRGMHVLQLLPHHMPAGIYTVMLRTNDGTQLLQVRKLQ